MRPTQSAGRIRGAYRGETFAIRPGIVGKHSQKIFGLHEATLPLYACAESKLERRYHSSYDCRAAALEMGSGRL
jgi:hypothetical protein